MKKLSNLLLIAAVVILIVTAFAGCSAKTYTVTFKKGDDVIATATVQENGKVYSANVPLAFGMRLDGWYTNSNLTGTAFDFALNTISSDLTLYAKIVSSLHTVSFICGEETIAESKTNENGKVYPANVVVDEGVRFDGWYIDDDFSEEFDFDTVVTNDISLYAKLTSLLYTVTYDLGGSGAGEAPVQDSVNANGTFDVTDTIPQRTGYVFLGWSDGKSLYQAGDNYDVDGADNIVLTAIWEYKTVTVRFLDDVGEEFLAKEVPYGSDCIAPISYIVPHTYFCYQQTGWDKSLEKITEDIDVNAIYSYVPTDESLFTFTLNDDGESYSIAKKVTDAYPSYVALPNEYNGKPVTHIGFKAFYTAFNNSMTTTLYIPGSIKVIDSEAFYRCMNIETLILEEGVEQLGIWTFQNWWGLKTVVIPQSLTDWGVNAFDACDVLEEYIVTGDMSNLVLIDGSVYSADGTILYAAYRKTDGEFIVPESVKNIWHGAFNNMVGYDEDWNQIGLTSVVFEGDIDEIGCEAFASCSLLTNVTFNGTVKMIRGYDPVYEEQIGTKYSYDTDYVAEKIFLCRGAFFWSALNCDLVLNGIEYIGGEAFSCPLTNITLDNTIKYIGEAAFVNTPSDMNLYIGGNLNGITMLNGTVSLNGKIKVIDNAIVTVGTGINGGDTLMIYAQNSSAVNYTTPAGVTTIAPYAFEYLNGTQNVIISEGVEFISAGAFMNANSLVSVTLPNSLKTLDDNLPYFGSVMQGGSVRGAFLQCSLLTTVNWAEGTPTIEYIGGNTFNYTAIETFRIPASVKHIGLAAFSALTLTGFTVDEENMYFSEIDGVLFDKNGSTLVVYPSGKEDESYTTPVGTQTIGSFAFNMCYNLTTVTLSEGVTTIQSKGFNYCAEEVYDMTLRKWVAIGGLETVNLPQSLTEVGDNAFVGSSYLKTLVFTGNAPVFSRDADAAEHNTLGYTAYDMETDMEVRKVFDNLTITIPEGKANEYYVALYNYSPTYTVLINQEDLTLITYNFETNGGSEIESESSVLVPEMPIPTKEGIYFAGWYLDEGTWQQEVKFPYAYLDGNSVTLYAKWDIERRQNGQYGIWAIELFDGDNTVNLTAGKYTWFCYTPQIDCKGLLEIPSLYYEYYALTIDYFPSEPWNYSVEMDYMTGEFIFNAGQTYYFYIWVGEDVVDGNLRMDLKAINNSSILIMAEAIMPCDRKLYL